MQEEYSEKKHFALIKSWMDARNRLGLEPWMLPEFGIVANGRSAAFLVFTNSPVAFIRHWATAPDTKREDRDADFAQILDDFEQRAKASGYRMLETMGRPGGGITKLLREQFIWDDHPYDFFVKSLG